MERMTDPIFLGLTRPAMLFGVPQSFFVMNAVLCMVAFLATGSFYPIFLGGPSVHGLGYLACLRDARTFDIWWVKAKFLKCLNRGYWKANSYDPS
jgi:type IV secretion system protein VirB3